MEEFDVKEHNFDYQSVLQRTMLLIKNVEKIDDKKQNYINDTRKEYSKYMVTRKQHQENLGTLLEVKLLMKKDLDGIHRLIKMNEELDEEIQQRLTKKEELKAEQMRYAAALKGKIDEMEKELEDLKLRFEGESLQKMMDDEEKEIVRFRQTLKQLQQTPLTQRPTFSSNLVLTQIADELRFTSEESIQDLDEKISNTDIEIQKIIREHEEKVAMWRDY